MTVDYGLTWIEALETARVNYKAHRTAIIAHLFGRGPEPDDAAFGHRHGWYRVEGFSFSVPEITGEPYDHTQGGWAHL